MSVESAVAYIRRMREDAEFRKRLNENSEDEAANWAYRQGARLRLHDVRVQTGAGRHLQGIRRRSLAGILSAMSGPSRRRRYQLILADIAMAAAIQICGGALEPSRPRRLCARRAARPLARRSNGGARCASASRRWPMPASARCSNSPPERLQRDRRRASACRSTPTLATTMAEHFVAKREAWLQIQQMSVSSSSAPARR